jgi:hypothetical protein
MANKPLSIAEVAKRAGITVREMRDVVTAAGTVAKTAINIKGGKGTVGPTGASSARVKAAVNNLGTQIKEVGSAAAKGKKGTTSLQTKTGEDLKPGKSRTQVAKPKVTPKAKPKLSKSEEAFLAGQKKKAQITKRTGVYPNTAN